MNQDHPDHEQVRKALRAAALSQSLIEQRAALARLTVEVFAGVGRDVHVTGWIIGPDRAAGNSPFGNGSDETVAIGTLLRIAAQLVGGAVRLFEAGAAYGGASLIRQLVEVEYLAWAFQTRDGDAERWLRSDHRERQRLFSPVNLRKGSAGRFRDQDYRFHCEHGGHPVPGASALLDGDPALVQLLMVDMLGHAGRIWDHAVVWARTASLGDFILKRSADMSGAYGPWKDADPLASLPAPGAVPPAAADPPA
jgi:hypothetical protein